MEKERPIKTKNTGIKSEVSGIVLLMVMTIIIIVIIIDNGHDQNDHQSLLHKVLYSLPEIHPREHGGQ